MQLGLASIGQQIKCGTNSVVNQYRLNDEKLTINSSFSNIKLSDLESPIIKVPVVVHIIHKDLSSTPKPGSSSNITDNQVYSQIRVLNEDFRRKVSTNGFNSDPLSADIEIEFCLASASPDGLPTTGINRIYNPTKKWSVSNEVELKSLSYWPSDSYLNIWVTELEDIIGYAKYPGGTSLPGIDNFYEENLDGVVIDYRVFGTNGTAVYPYNLGRTTTHEVGHWLSLLHVWGATDELCGDDYVNDTPLDEAANKDNDCIDSSNCTGTKVADNTSNYLDFSPDRCMNLFTNGQKIRMRQAIERSPLRNKILISKGCSLPPIDDYKIKIFPVPASTNLIIQTNSVGLEEIAMQVIDYNGITIYENSFDFTTQIDYKLNVTQFKNGVYVLKTTKNGKINLFKFVVIH